MPRILVTHNSMSYGKTMVCITKLLEEDHFVLSPEPEDGVRLLISA